MDAIAIAERLREGTRAWRPGRADVVVYRPLDYAWDVHREYLARYARGKKRYVFVGMNPGPFGMGQTGVPFGDVSWVREWLGLAGTIVPPANELPGRLVQGWDCPRGEVSGQRMWGWMAARYGTAQAWACEALIWNYCPLLFLESGAGRTVRNLTPDKFPKPETRELFAACDDALHALVALTEVETLVAVGNFAEGRCRQVPGVGESGGPRLVKIPHPSPANPQTNDGQWAVLADRALAQAP